MTNTEWSHLLGLAGKPRRWERPLLFFAALCPADLVWLIVAPSTRWTAGDDSVSLELWNFGGPFVWLELMFGNLFLATLAAAAFGLIRNLLAIPVIAIIYGLVWPFFSYIFIAAQFHGTRPHIGESYQLLYLLNIALWPAFFFGLTEVALRLISNRLLALLIGAVANSVLFSAAILVVGKLTAGGSTNTKARLLLLPFSILGSALLALTLYAGLRITSGRTPMDETSPVSRLSQGYYVGTLAVTNGVSILYSLAAIVLMLTGVWKLKEIGDIIPVLLLLGMAFLLAAYGAVVFCVLIYRMWAVIQDGYARTTPGWAVGALFIPFYNFYWIFQAFPGFAKDFNAFAERYQLPARLSTGVFTAYGVVCIISAIPYVGLLLVPAGYVLQLVLTSRVCRAVNTVTAPLAQADDGPAAPITW
ncbi:MAG TPA: hypothetical protein VFV34_09935 [Blastocatellia bacterium]|nr:hypothetical protein [Blastocatellia bacterium]